MTREVPTAEFASLVFGPAGIRNDDPAETFHEASRLYPNVAPGRLATLLALSTRPELQQTVERSSRRHGHRPAIELPRATLSRRPFGELVEARRSLLSEQAGKLSLADLAAVLHASYAANSRAPGVTRRPVPSGGALYPLELYVLALAVDGLEPSVSHYDPFRHRLEVLGSLERSQLGDALVDPVLVDRASAAIVLTAAFWRSRFKYGTRGYRFALLEAGHVMQNAVLSAASLRLEALPVGGFYDRRCDRLVGANGLDEATLYVLLLGASR